MQPVQVPGSTVDATVTHHPTTATTVPSHCNQYPRASTRRRLLRPQGLHLHDASNTVIKDSRNHDHTQHPSSPAVPHPRGRRLRTIQYPRPLASPYALPPCIHLRPPRPRYWIGHPPCIACPLPLGRPTPSPPSMASHLQGPFFSRTLGSSTACYVLPRLSYLAAQCDLMPCSNHTLLPFPSARGKYGECRSKVYVCACTARLLDNGTQWHARKNRQTDVEPANPKGHP